MTQPQLVQIVARERARRTGWFKDTRAGLPQPLSHVLNNPGMISSWSQYFGGPEYDTAYGYVCFPTPEEGWKALMRHTTNRIVKKRYTAYSFFRENDDKSREALGILTRQLSISTSQILADLITEDHHAAQRRHYRVASQATGGR